MIGAIAAAQSGAIGSDLDAVRDRAYPRRSVLNCLRPCSPAPTRWSN